jgi:hypothetical protein
MVLQNWNKEECKKIERKKEKKTVSSWFAIHGMIDPLLIPQQKSPWGKFTHFLNAEMMTQLLLLRNDVT